MSTMFIVLVHNVTLGAFSDCQCIRNQGDFFFCRATRNSPVVSPRIQTQAPKRRGPYSMNATGQRFLTALTLAALTAGAWAQTQTASNVAPTAPSAEAPTSLSFSPDQQLRSEVEQLKQMVREQQQRIDALEAGRKGDPQLPAVVASVAPVVSAPAKALDSSSAPQADGSQPQTTPRAQNVQAG